VKQTLIKRLIFARHFVIICQSLLTCSVNQTLVTNAILTSIFTCHDRTCRFVKQVRWAGQCKILVSEEIFSGFSYMITALRSV
jgi:hypothetical protein